MNTMSNSFDLTGKIAIITGASAGIGQGLSVALAQAGANIVGVDRASVEETGNLVTAAGGKFLPIHADLSSIEPIQGILDDTVKWAGHADILINNAGIIRRTDAIDFSEKDWDDVLNVNLKSVFFLSQTVARQMLKQGTGGKMINIASMLSFQGGIRIPSYTASKSGVAGITRLLACEWAGKGINVNAIAPGYFATANTQQLRDDPERSKSILERIPAGRWGLPADLGGAAVFLSSKASDYVHGIILPVDGGWLVR
jgi:2-deoxy-D-gluconate 3-dehydrogenase